MDSGSEPKNPVEVPRKYFHDLNDSVIDLEVYLKRSLLQNSISPISAGPFQLKKPLFSKLLARDIASQSQSVLFSRIPGEIRQKIFEYACTSTDMRDEPVPQVALYHRPGYEHYQRVWTDLLRTCRRVYLETHLLPASVNEHVFWCYDGPPQLESQPYNFESPHNYMNCFLRLKLRTQEQKNAVQELHFFTQQFWLDMEGYGIGTRSGETAWMIAASTLAVECRPRKIKITIRHRDWWSWDEPLSSHEKLGIHPFRSSRAVCEDMDKRAQSEERAPWAWGYQLKRFQGLQELEMEFETIEAKAKQLDAVVQHALTWRFPLSDGKVLTTEDMPVVQSRWHSLGDKHITYPPELKEIPGVSDNQDAHSSGGQTADDPTKDRQPDWEHEHGHLTSTFDTNAVDRDGYYVISVRWKARNASV